MSSTAKKPTLLTIPRELRDLIYEWIFADTKVDVESNRLAARNAALLCTCKTIYCEALKPYYQLSIFTCKTHYMAFIEIPLWAGFISTYARKWIKHIRIEHTDRDKFAAGDAEVDLIRKVLREKSGFYLPDGILHLEFTGEDGETILWYPEERKGSKSERDVGLGRDFIRHGVSSLTVAWSVVTRSRGDTW